jgi:hypothetical protein
MGDSTVIKNTEGAAFRTSAARLVFAAFLLSGLGAGLHGQEYRGTFSGSVKDAQGAAIAQAKVVVTETQTGNKSETLSSATGEYTVPYLIPGEYEISAEVAGFKKFLRKGLTLKTGDHPVIDIVMEVGTINQEVTITGEVPLIEASNASAGEVITTEEVEDMPINGRTALMLSRLALGVLSTNEPGPVRPFDNANAAAFTMSGAPAQANELLLNGAPDGTWDKRMAYSPPQDAVVEVRVQSFESDAAYGHSGGGTVNVNTKGGTNGLHGSLYEFNQVSLLEANSFFQNKNGIPRSAYHYNQYGGTAGGPVYIPKLYNGKNKMFWFFGYEGLKDSDPTNAPAEGGPTVITVPTDAERKGDFSALLNLNTSGTSYQIYNPFSGVTQGSRTSRSPFVNNVIPTSLLNPIALNYLKWYPEPNIPGRADGFTNYGITAPDWDTGDNELARVDFNLSDASKLAVDFRHSNRFQNKNNYFRNIGFGQYLHRTNWGTTVDEVYTVSPTVVLDIRANWTRFIDDNNSPSDGFDPTSVGFPSYLAANSQFPGLPYMVFGTCTGTAPTSFQCLGMNGDTHTPFDIYQLFGSVMKIHGNHTVKVGGDLRYYRESTFAHGNSAGSFTYSTNWTRGPLDNAASSPFGQDFASFLLGLPTSGSFDLNTLSSQQSKYFAVFVQDDWRARSDLTINLGLRWEHEGPVAERYNRTADGFDPNVVNPISQTAAANYALHPVPQIPVSQFKALGGLSFASPGDPGAYNTLSYIVSPRVGFAWVPKKLGKGTVIRAGFGVFVTPIGISNGLALNQQGFGQTTQYVVTNNNYLSPAGSISDPFPNGILRPSQPNSGTFLGQQVKFFNPNVLNPYSMRWNFGIQRQLPGKFVLEAVYIGNHTVHQFITDQNLNPIPRQYLSTLPYRDSATINLLSGSVANPFQGLLPNSSSLNGATVSLSQLLVPFPQFPTGSGVDRQDSNGGESYFHSLNIRLQKRMTQGMTLINNFMYSSTIERITYLNDTDPAPEKRVSGDSRPLRESLGMTYEVPVGKGKKFHPNSRIVQFLAAGWGLNGMMTFQSGPPLSWGNDVIYYGGPLNFNSHQPNGAAFDTTQFNTVSSQQLSNHIRTFHTYFNNLRRDPTKNLDLSALKRFTLGERKYLQLRFEGFNVTNRVTFAAPAQLNPTNSAFGIISSQANNPRKIQIGARLVW